MSLCYLVSYPELRSRPFSSTRSTDVFYSKFYVFDALSGGVDQARISAPLGTVPFLDYRSARVWLSDMLRAALFLERCRVVHLDIKLSNMLVDADDRLRFCDLGFAVSLVSN